jgi:hypothetical protein
MGWIPAAMGIAGLIGKITGHAGKEAADQRTNQNQQLLQQQGLINQLFGTHQNAVMQALMAGSNEKQNQTQTDLEQRKFALAAPGARASQAVRGSLIQNVQPASFSGLPDRVSNSIPHLSGGLNPSAISAEARGAGGELTRQAVMNLLKGDQFAPQTPTDFNAGVLPVPQMGAMQQPGKLESILGALGLGGSLLGGIGDLYNTRRRTQATEPSDSAGWG